MQRRDFWELVGAKWKEGRFLCIGLDTDIRQVPVAAHRRTNADTLLAFNRNIVEATADLVCAYKPNVAFYERLGSDGITALQRTASFIRDQAPDVPLILDAKRGDIASTNSGYVDFTFEYVGADGITIHPYPGMEAMEPFLQLSKKGIFVLCRTSNPGAAEFQDLLVNGRPLYEAVAKQVATQWNYNHNCGLVVAATYPDELAHIRHLVPEMPFLIPGIGAQGGKLDSALRAGLDARGEGVLLSTSRTVIFASGRQDADYAEAARKAAWKLHEDITMCRLTLNPPSVK
jgi:orotidine-5'-phosphate decarboxylase